MGARVIVVHDEPVYADRLAIALRSAGHTVTLFVDPLDAWETVGANADFEVLVTQMIFPPARSNGVALARMAHARRPAVGVVLTADPDMAAHADGVGVFVPTSDDIAAVVDAVRRVLKD